jgi:hypothetical protein
MCTLAQMRRTRADTTAADMDFLQFRTRCEDQLRRVMLSETTAQVAFLQQL